MEKVSYGKMVIIGAGNVGSAILNSVLRMNILDNIVVVNRNQKKALGEVLNVEEYQDDQYGRYVSSSINMSRASGAVAEATMDDMGVMPGEMDVEAVIRVEFALTDSQ